MTITLLVLLRMRNISVKSCMENQNTHFIFNNFFPKIPAVCEVCGRMWWRQTGHNGDIIRRMRIESRITKAEETHSNYVIFTPLPQLQCLHEHVSILGYT